MKAEALKQQLQKVEQVNEVRVYRAHDRIVNDKRLEKQFDYYEVLDGKGLDEIIDRLVKS